MINSIKNGDQPLPHVTQVSIAGTTSTEQPPLKDKSMWFDQEKRVQKIDRLARSLLIQGLPNDIYSLIDSNKTVKDLWDALASHMLGSEYGEQDRKAAVLYEYETFKATEGELLLDTYIRYLQYATMMRQNKNLMDINIDALYNILKQNQGDVNDVMGSKKKTVVVTSDPLALIAEKTNVNRSKEKVVVSSNSEGSEADDFKSNVITARRKDILPKTTRKQSDSDQEINANMVFMAQIEKVLSDSEASSSSADEKISKVSYYLSESESETEFETSKYYDNSTNNGLFVNNDDDQELFHDAIDYASENFIENHIDSQIDYDKSDVEKANQQSKDFENQNKDLQDKYDVLKNQTTTFEMNNKELNEQLKELIEKNNDLLAQTKVLKDQPQVKHVVIDTHVECQEKKGNGFENLSYFEKAKDLRPTLYDEKLTSSLKPYVSNVILKKIIIDLEDEVINLLEKEKVNMETIESLKSKKFESSEKVCSESENQSENDCLVVEKECHKEENPKKKKGSSNTSNADLSSDSLSNLNKNVKRYSRKDLLSCNNSHLGETSSAYVCNDAMNVSCNSRMCDLLDDNNFFIFDDESVKISHVSKMPFRKKPRDSMN
nr:integrase, catalytic region, zinc finger, CCHC-type, peptidase aspartic, catalytic [Tanacetum cinerariifolium]